MRTVAEVSNLSGINVRTLHHYDAIVLLKPTDISSAGYRLYDDATIIRSREILLLRELLFPLKDIKVHRMKEGDASDMDMSAFKNDNFEKYSAEAKQRWGSTEAYADYEKRAASKTVASMKDAGVQLMEVIAEVAAMRPIPPDDDKVAEKARAIQRFISENFYECTDAVFVQLADMYTADPRMKSNIDKSAGENAAEYVSQAIKACFR